MFITFEGPDGCGKSTQVPLLVEYLTGQGYTVCQTREPGGTPIGEQIRAVVHDPDNVAMADRTEILLYAASRAQLVEQVIRPALAAGQIVIADRYADSTLAYQGYGRGLDLVMVRQLVEIATGGLRPDLTIYLDIDPETGLRRRQRDGDAEWNRLDAATLDFHRRVREGYRRLIAEEPGRWFEVDGGEAVDVIQRAIRQAVDTRLRERAE
jgi:dTMP kinase